MCWVCLDTSGGARAGAYKPRWLGATAPYSSPGEGLCESVMVNSPCYNTISCWDNNLVNVFLERWHQETSFFHLPIEEITITLDDVSCLLHLLVVGRPKDHVPSLFDREAVKILLMSHMDILTKTKASVVANASARMRLKWLEHLYHHYVESNSYV